MQSKYDSKYRDNTTTTSNTNNYNKYNNAMKIRLGFHITKTEPRFTLPDE
jgi:hypothetical protein